MSEELELQTRALQAMVRTMSEFSKNVDNLVAIVKTQDERIKKLEAQQEARNHEHNQQVSH